MLRVALLDDYQAVALDSADWGSLPADVAVEAFRDHLADEAHVAESLRPFNAVSLPSPAGVAIRTLTWCSAGGRPTSVISVTASLAGIARLAHEVGLTILPATEVPNKLLLSETEALSRG